MDCTCSPFITLLLHFKRRFRLLFASKNRPEYSGPVMCNRWFKCLSRQSSSFTLLPEILPVVDFSSLSLSHTSCHQTLCVLTDEHSVPSVILPDCHQAQFSQQNEDHLHSGNLHRTGIERHSAHCLCGHFCFL